MASYRLFYVGRNEHIVKADVVDCPTDQDAIEAAGSSRGDYQAVEVWELARRVARVTPAGS